MLPWVDLPLVGLSVEPYALVQTFYLLAAVVLTARLHRRAGVDVETTVGAFVVGIPAGLLGARLVHLAEYRAAGETLATAGYASYGGYLGGFAALLVYSRLRGISALRFLDAGAPSMALAEAIARIGCFLAGCCHGVPWDGALAVTFPAGSVAFRDQLAHGQLSPGATHSLPVHPVQLYGTAVMAVVFVALWRLHGRGRRPEGVLFFAFLALYGVLRSMLLPLRADAHALQAAFGVAFLIAGLAGLLWRLAPAVRDRSATA